MSEEASLWTDDQDELRRAFIMSHYGMSPDFKAKSMIMDMEMMLQWLKHGKVPERKPKVTH